MVEELCLTISGEQLRRLLNERIDTHRRDAERWMRDPLLPENMCENAAERHEWRIEVLEFIRDNVEPGETYRLTEADLVFGELLPARPGWLVPDTVEADSMNLRALAKA